ncbi:formylglycine-generating enzyme family protein [Oleiharenicola sp. Vm1]|uniref:formylglycine-generating enzyme family protein n=1 Tax=Oleiharenicola sp. Vm1 TaxID=3398393 RepID=UPI0039F60EF2
MSDAPAAGTPAPLPPPQRAPSAHAAEFQLSHARNGPHLPLPASAPGWPFQNIGHWKMDIRPRAEAWRRDFRDWRREHLTRMGYSGANYERPEFAWAQRNFVHAQMMVEDRFFYDPVARRYTVDRYLDDLEARFGGIDSVLLWYVYPNVGIDDRNQFELAADLPGGLAGLKQVVADFHRRGVKVFIPTMPWDNGTCPAGVPDWVAIARLAKEIGADGVNGDTYSGVPRAFLDAADAIGHPLVFQPEAVPLSDEALMWNLQSWGKHIPTDVIPAVSKLKWLEPRHMSNIENRWGRDRTNDFHYIFFNGIGYNAWENIWGVWNQLTPRDAETLRRIATIYRQFPSHVVSLDWEPYATTVQHSVFASRFPTADSTLWTVVNRNEYEVAGDQLVVAHREGRRYFDLWNGSALTPRLAGGQATLAFPLESRGFGAVLAVEPGREVADLEKFLARMAALARTPLQSLSATWRPLLQEIVPVAPTRPHATAPHGMVTIPAGEFDFKVLGVEIEGFTWSGLDFQYPWESTPRRAHWHRLQVPAFHLDRFPVTNAEFKAFLDASGYHPADDHHFLRHWQHGAPPAGWEKKPVTWVSLEDARAYAAWAGKRLPREWEWHYAAQGTDGRLYPWGNDWRPAAMPKPNRGRTLTPPDDVDAHPEGASPFGVMDLVGNVWQWTDEFRDAHTRAAALRGGSAYQPQTSHWYFPQAYQLDQHGKYLLMAPGKDRSGMIGFRCAADAS